MPFDYDKDYWTGIITTTSGTTSIASDEAIDLDLIVPFITNTLTINVKNNKKHKAFVMPNVTKVMHTKQGSTVVFFDDGTKTWVNPAEGTEPDPFVGFCMAVMKRLYGSTSNMIRDYENHLTGGGANGCEKGKCE